MSSYLEIKKRFDGQDSFIDYVENLDNPSLSEFCRGVLYSRHVDSLLYNELRDFIKSKDYLLSSKLYSMFNLLYILKEEKLEDDISKIIEIESKLFGYLLSGPLGHRVELIRDIFANVTTIPVFHQKALQQYFYSKNIKLNIPINYYNESKVKVALLVSGQIRGIETALKSWLEFFDFNNVELDVVISTWEQGGHPKKVNTSRIKGNSDIEEKVSKFLKEGIPHNQILELLYKYLPPSIITKEYLEDVFNKYLSINRLIVDIEDEKKFTDYSNPMKLYYKIQRAFELSRGIGAYDLYIRIRPDLKLGWDNKLGLVDVYNNLKGGAKKLLTHYPYIYEYYGFGVDDKLAISTYDGMSIYSKTWDYTIHKNQMKGHMDLATNLMGHNIIVDVVCDGLKVDMVDYNL